jgi:uncharacterized protein (TIGR02217 family)
MSFFELEFPTTLSLEAVGGPTFSTQVNQGFSGGEQRNRNWANARGEWTVSLITPAGGPPRQTFIDLLNAFFRVLGGMADSFRLKDPTDFQATGQTLASLGSNNYQLQKTYTIGARSYVRTITKPIWNTITDYRGNALANTVVLKSSGTLLTYGSAWTMDPTTGIITTTNGSLTADFQFHVPVRLNSDKMKLAAKTPLAGGIVAAWNSIELIETLPPNY